MLPEVTYITNSNNFIYKLIYTIEKTLFLCKDSEINRLYKG